MRSLIDAPLLPGCPDQPASDLRRQTGDLGAVAKFQGVAARLRPTAASLVVLRPEAWVLWAEAYLGNVEPDS